MLLECVLALLQEVMSVGWSVGQSVGWSVTQMFEMYKMADPDVFLSVVHSFIYPFIINLYSQSLVHQGALIGHKLALFQMQHKCL